MFYGFKLHISINDCGEILGLFLTPWNKDDRNPEVMGHLTENIFGKLFADKDIFPKNQPASFKKWHPAYYKTKKNFKTKSLMDLSDKILLRKRAVIESVNDFLKNICHWGADLLPFCVAEQP